MTPEAITALSTAVLAVITLFLVIATAIAGYKSVKNLQATNEQGRLTLSIELLLSLDDNFNSTQMRRTRAEAARFLLDNKNRVGAADELGATFDVVGFFEKIANWVSTGALDEEAVWVRFYQFMYTYWFFADSHLKFVYNQPEGAIYWKSLRSFLGRCEENLNARMYAKYAKYRVQYPGLPSPTTLESFLTREAQRSVQQPPSAARQQPIPPAASEGGNSA
jgi:hypothetical protein